MPMTNQERAEKIGNTVGGCTKEEIDLITSQLDEAVREARLEDEGKHPLLQCFCAGKNKYVAELCRGCHCRIGYEWEDDTIQDLKDRIFDSAKDKAAGVAEHKECGPYLCDCVNDVSIQQQTIERIRALRAEEK